MTPESFFAVLGGKSAVAVVTLIVLMGSIGALLFWVVAVPVLGGPEKIKQIFDASDDLNRLAQDINRAVNRPPLLPQTGVCGNGICEADENVHVCLLDCFVCNENGICETNIGENQNSCPADCTAAPVCNQNDHCEPQLGENGTNCVDCRNGGTDDPTDPTDPLPTASCGDNVCQTSESCTSCASDCGVCTNTSCTDNSGVCQTTCGNGLENYPAGIAQCSPLRKICCVVSSQTSSTNFFFDDFDNYNFINTNSLSNVEQTQSTIRPLPTQSAELTPSSSVGSGLVGLWHLNDNSSGAGIVILDSSGYNQHGTAFGNVNCLVAGRFGTGCYFDGNNQEIRIPATFSDAFNFTGATAFTLSAWVKSPVVFTGGGRNILGRMTGSNGSPTLYADNQNPSRYGISFYNETQSQVVSCNTVRAQADTWQHVAGVFGNGTATIFVNGTACNSAPVTGTPTQPSGQAGGQIWIGGFSSSITGSDFVGVIDEAAIWNRALSESEIAQLAAGTTHTVYAGSFESTTISTQAPIYGLRTQWTETAMHTQIDVSFDNGTTWCAIQNNSAVSHPNCLFPASQFKYRARFTNNTSLSSIRFDYNITAPVQTCGNGLREGTEICDGADLSGESCATQGFTGGTLSCRGDCAGYATTTCTSTTPSVCGNGVITGNEQCDDGGTQDGDGCSATCQQEAGFSCTGQPSVCGIHTPAVFFVDSQLTGDCTAGNYSIANRNCSGINGKAYNTVQEASTVSQAGDTIYIRAGQYQEIVTHTKNGTASAPITIAGYNSERPVIYGTGFEDRDLDGDGDADGISASPIRQLFINANYVHVRNLEITNAAGYGVDIRGSYNLAEDLIVHDNWGTNVSISAYADNSSEYNIVRNIESYRSRRGSGVMILNAIPASPEPRLGLLRYNIVEDSLLYNNGRTPDGQIVLPYTGDAVGGGNSDGLAIAKACFDDADRGIVEIDNLCSDNILRNNILFGNTDDGIDVSFAHSSIVNNISFNNGPRGNRGFKVLRETTDLTITGNVMIDNFEHGFELRGENHTILNNFSLRNQNRGFTGVRGSYSFQNNAAGFNSGTEIAGSCSGCAPNWSEDINGPLSLANPSAQINTVFPAGYSISQKWQFLSDQFKAAFMPTASSPLVNAGVPIAGYHCATAGTHPGDNCREWYGTKPDIGAFEFVE